MLLSVSPCSLPQVWSRTVTLECWVIYQTARCVKCVDCHHTALSSQIVLASESQKLAKRCLISRKRHKEGSTHISRHHCIWRVTYSEASSSLSSKWLRSSWFARLSSSKTDNSKISARAVIIEYYPLRRCSFFHCLFMHCLFVRFCRHSLCQPGP